MKGFKWAWLIGNRLLEELRRLGSRGFSLIADA